MGGIPGDRPSCFPFNPGDNDESPKHQLLYASILGFAALSGKGGEARSKVLIFKRPASGKADKTHRSCVGLTEKEPLAIIAPLC